jgi:hypothetical protein
MKKFDLVVTLLGLLISFNLVVMIDAASIWSGAEAALLWDIPRLAPLYARLGVVLCMLLGAFLVYRTGAPLLGARTVLLGLLVAGSSLYVPLFSHVGTFDAPVMVTHTLAVLSLLRYLRQPGWRWQLMSIVWLLLSMFMAPWSSALLFVLYPVLLWRLTDWRKHIIRLNPWVMALSGLAFSYFVYGGELVAAVFQVRSYSALFFAGPLLGMLPYLGFVLAGFRDYVAKLIRGDEFSQVVLFWMLAALLAGSPAWSMALALLVARQLDAYFVQGYPYANFVKTGALIHLVAAFFICTGLMMSGLHYFGGAGFRAGLGMSAAYWSLSFMGVIGLFGFRRIWVLGGPMLAGALMISLWWTQLFPLIEAERRENLALLEQIDCQELHLMYTDRHGFPAIAVYARERYPELSIRVGTNKQAIPLSGNIINTADRGAPIPGWTIQARPDSLRWLNPYTLLEPAEKKK